MLDEVLDVTGVVVEVECLAELGTRNTEPSLSPSLFYFWLLAIWAYSYKLGTVGP